MLTGITAALVTWLVIGLLLPPASAAYRNGKRFDPGHEMTRGAEGAPAELDRVSVWLAQWDVAVTVYRQEGKPLHAQGQAEISLMNRGQALMESLYSGGRDPYELATPTTSLSDKDLALRYYAVSLHSSDDPKMIAEAGRRVEALRRATEQKSENE